MNKIQGKKVIIIGAGPGGLSAGMLLASRGFEVEIFEKDSSIGGRNKSFTSNGFTFDLGPTFVLLPDVFKEIFTLANKNIEDYLDLKKIDPLYRLNFDKGKDLLVFNDKEKLKGEIKRLFPGEENGYDKWFNQHKEKFEKTYECLKIPYLHIYDYLRYRLLRALPTMQIHKSINSVLKAYFKREEMHMAMGFQAKYLGMSPWQCPGAFSILSYAEHAFGIFHPIGGVNLIANSLAKIINEYGGKIHLNKCVKQILVQNKIANGIILEDGTIEKADHIIINADFAYAMKNLLDEKDRPSFKNKKIENFKYSCSTLMLYLGLKKKYNIPHHNIFFGSNYKLNVQEIIDGKGIPTDPAFYIQNASITDSSLAPEGKSTIYVLVPVSNLNSNFKWEENKKEIRNYLIKMIEKKSELSDLENNIEFEKIITPIDWEKENNVYKGAVFNLGHNIKQMLYLRPHNRFNDIKNLYLVGGGTHPGSGLPTILESGRIAADLISDS